MEMRCPRWVNGTSLGDIRYMMAIPPQADFHAPLRHVWGVPIVLQNYFEGFRAK